jgi:hypothetical protein
MRSVCGWLALCALMLSSAVGTCGVISVIGSLSQQATALPGGAVQGTVLVRNHSDRPQTTRVYQTDYDCYADGRCLFGEPGSSPRSNAPWITLTAHRLELAAQQTATVRYTVQVPSDPKLVGTYWSVIMIETGAEPAAPTATGKPAVGMAQVLRYGVQVVTDIGQTGQGDLQLSHERLDKNAPGRCFMVDAENTGERSLLPVAWVELFDASGTSQGRFHAEARRIYPGCSARFQFDLTAVPPGRYRALLVLDNRDESIFGAQYDLDLR